MGKEKLTKIQTISIPEDEIWVLEEIKKLANLDRWPISRVILEAMKEYLERHAKGQPQTMLVPRTHPYVNPVLEKRRDLLADLLADIRSHPGQTLDLILGEWGRIHGLREETVRTYLKQLGRAKKIKIRGSKVYPR